MRSPEIVKNPGKKVTLRDIARHLNVSPATVSRALNGTADPLISQRTIERVQQATAELGYRPNHSARALATGRTGLVALWLWAEKLHGSYHAKVSQEMHRQVVKRSRQLLVDLVDREELSLTASGQFHAWDVDGIIAHESATALESHLKAMRASATPIVATGVYCLVEGVDQVRVDISVGANQAMQHLVDSGRRRIAYAAHEQGDGEADVRHDAYVRGMEGIGRGPEYIAVGPTRQTARAAIREYVERHSAPEAIFCHSDELAIGIYRGLCDLGLKTPSDVALIGCDGIDDCEYLEVPLTTIVQPISELCSIATKFLDERIEDPTRPLQEAVLTAELVVRDSS